MKKAWLPILGLLSALALAGYFFYSGQLATGEISAKPGAPMKLRVLIEQSYGEADIELPLRQLVEEILEPARVELLAPEATEFDATLAIKVTGRAHGGNYLGPGLVYSGALVSGTISLEGREGSRLERAFCRDIEPPSFVEIKGGKPSSDPSTAPFPQALLGRNFGGGGWCDVRSDAPPGEPREPEPEEPRGGFLPALLEIVGETYGYQLVVPVAVREGIGVSRWGRLSPLRSHPGVRLSAATALGQIGDPGAVTALIEVLQKEDERSEVRIAAVLALGKLGDARALEPLLAALEDEKFDVRLHAASALGQLGDPRAGERLVALAADKSEPASWEARNALRILADKHGVPQPKNPERWGAWWERNKHRFQASQ